MATLNEAQAGIAFRTAFGFLGRTPERSEVGLGYDIKRAMGPAYASINDSTWRAVARRAIAARDAAETMRDDPAYAPRAGQLSTIPGSTLYAERYQYRVLISYTGEDGNEYRLVYEYRSDSPLSQNDIGTDLEQRVRNIPGQFRSGGSVVTPDRPFGAVSIEVLSAGKRG